VRQAVWFDSDTILATANERNGEAFSIWQISYPSGAAQKLTNDLNSYPIISLTADAGSIAAVKTEVDSNIWVMPAFDGSRATQITQGRNPVGLPAWTPDGKLVCSIKAPVGRDLYLIDPVTGTRQQLTAETGDNFYASVSPDGRYIVFLSDRTGTPHVWRIDIDGSNVKQLTNTAEDLNANISPDGRWVAYTSFQNKGTVWKVAIDGGQPVQITDKASDIPAFSPDGKQIACGYLDRTLQLAIVPSDGGQPIKTFSIPVGLNTNHRWSADGRALIYGVTQKGVTNLWAQPIDGSPPKQLTNFASESIFSFDLSRDGKQVALSRGTQSSDVVLISNFKR
jgi:Tol biopolymer transport system component